jgi:hypothetical protein
MGHNADHGKGYSNTEARMGHSPKHEAMHEKQIKSMDSKEHLTDPHGGHTTGKVGKMHEESEHAKTPTSKSSMPAVKKVAGGSNYEDGKKDYPIAKR